jgi:hypothetical protein
VDTAKRRGPIEPHRVALKKHTSHREHFGLDFQHLLALELREKSLGAKELGLTGAGAHDINFWRARKQVRELFGGAVGSAEISGIFSVEVTVLGI